MAQLHIIFDLDGTLIDSAPSILGAFKQVLEKFSYAPTRPMSSDLIGPPLKQTLQLISGESNPEKLNFLVEAFKTIYDNDAYRLSKSYPGVNNLLKSFFNAGKVLHIATNKRLTPTQKIIEYFEWGKYFKSIYAIDKSIPSYLNKAQMIKAMILDLCLQPEHCVYIGDQIEDGNAAAENFMPFIYADWGYGPILPELRNYHSVKSSNDLYALLCNANIN